jgi:hypothetical protein
MHDQAFNLKNMDFKKHSLIKIDDTFKLIFLCRDENQECNTLIDGNINGSRGDVAIGRTDGGIGFYIKYHSQAIKVQKAFIHLIQLFDKKELF